MKSRILPLPLASEATHLFWLDNTIPVQYRDAIREGILLWNNAFERIGFQNAVVVKQQPDDADWDPADVGYSTIRWFVGHPETGVCGRPSAVNPLTGEIFDADIRFDAGLTRFFRREKSCVHQANGRLATGFQPADAALPGSLA